MPIFKVAVKQKVWQSAVTNIEADNEDDAREAAERLWREGAFEWDWTEGDVDELFGVEAEVISQPATQED